MGDDGTRDRHGGGGGPSSPTVRAYRARRRSQRGAGLEAVADAITRFSGSMRFVLLHVVCTAWIASSVVLPRPFDPFPFGLLTLIVSLEAIFLSTFVLISQNRQTALTDARLQQDLQTDVYAEVLGEMVAEHLGVDAAEVRRRYRERVAAASGTGPGAPPD